MFVEGGCLCNGTLCNDVSFTFNLQLPSAVNSSEYWGVWKETVWWDLDRYQGGDVSGFSVGIDETIDDFLYIAVTERGANRAWEPPLSLIYPVREDQAGSVLRFEQTVPGFQFRRLPGYVVVGN